MYGLVAFWLSDSSTDSEPWTCLCFSKTTVYPKKPLSIKTGKKINIHKLTVVSARRLLQYFRLPNKNSRDISLDIYNFLPHFKVVTYLLHYFFRNPYRFCVEPCLRNTALCQQYAHCVGNPWDLAPLEHSVPITRMCITLLQQSSQSKIGFEVNNTLKGKWTGGVCYMNIHRKTKWSKACGVTWSKVRSGQQYRNVKFVVLRMALDTNCKMLRRYTGSSTYKKRMKGSYRNYAKYTRTWKNTGRKRESKITQSVLKLTEYCKRVQGIEELRYRLCLGI